MDLRQLKYFTAVADQGSFSAAARALRIAQPSLTVSVRSLEDELGEPLLARGPRGVTLTPIGATFITYARSILREADKAVDEVRQVRGLKHGKVSVGLMSVFSSFVAPDALARFYERNPNINVHVDVSAHATEAILESVENGSWDFAFALYRPLSNPLPSLKSEPVVTFESAVYAAPTHPLAKLRSASMQDLARSDWMVSSLSAGASFLHRTFEEQGLPRPQIKIVSNSFGLIRSIAQNAPFLCLLPVRFAAREVEAGRLVRIRQTAISVQSQAGLVCSARKELTPAARQLMAEFRAAAQRAAAY